MGADIEQSPEKKALLEKVINDYSWAAEYRKNYEQDWLRYYKLYKSYLSDKAYPFESRLFIPYSFAVIEAQIPTLIQTIFSSGSFIEVEGQNLNSEQFSSMVKDILSYQFERHISPFKLMHTFFKQSLIYGTSPALVDWSYRSENQKVRVAKKSIDGNVIKFVTKDLRRTIENNPIAKVIDIFRYFQCPSTPESPASSNNVLFCGFEFQITYEELLAGAVDGIYDLKDVKLLEGKGSTTDFMADKLSILDKPSVNKSRNNSRNILDGIHYFGRLPNAKGQLELRLVTVMFPGGISKDGNNMSGVIVRNVVNPLGINKMPIVLLRTNPTEGELYGIGDIQPIEPLQVELNDQRNQRCDIVVRSMNPMWKVKKGSDVDETMLQYRAHGLIELDDTDDLKPLDSNMNVQQSLVEEGVIKQDIQFATGVSDFVAGTYQNTSGFNDTATGISLIQNAAAGRMIVKAQFGQIAIKEMSELIWSMNSLHLPLNTVIKVLDPFSASKFRFLRVTPEMTAGQYQFSIVNASALGNPQVRRQQFVQLLDAFSKVLPAAAQAGQQISINYSQLVHRLLKEFEIRNISEILPDIANKQMISNIPTLLDNLVDDGQAIEPDEEHELIKEGTKNLPVHPGDDDLYHLLSHNEELADPSEGMDAKELEAHIILHQRQMEDKNNSLIETVNSGASSIASGAMPADLESSLTQLNGESQAPEAQEAETVIRDLANATAPGNRS